MPKTDSLFPPSHSAEGQKSHDDAAGRATALYSHPGARPEQQDNANIWKNPRTGAVLVIVCDGVGGSRSGGEASAIVVQTAGQLWRDRGESLPDPSRDLLSLSRVAHERITDLAHEGEKRAPASTIVALYLTPTEAHWIHSGDSRLYRFQDSQLVSRTRDHSVVQILVDQGEVREKDMGSHPDQGRLLQSLGVQEYRPPTYASAPVDETDGFLLCTDGFWERTPPAQMAALLSAGPGGLKEQLHKAVHRAVRANGPKGDNVTAAVVAPLRAAAGVAGFGARAYWLAALGVIVLAALFSKWMWLHKAGLGSPAKRETKSEETRGVSPSTTPQTLTPSSPAASTAPTKSPRNERATLAPAPAATPTGSNAPPTDPSSSPKMSVDPRRELTPSDASRQVVDLNKGFCLIDGVRYWRIETNAKFFFVAEAKVTEEKWHGVFANFALSTNSSLPVVGITAEQAVTFAKQLTDVHQAELPNDWGFRLPTTDEWCTVAGTRSFLPNGIKSADLLHPHDKNPIHGTNVLDLFGVVPEIVQDGSDFFAVSPDFIQPSWANGVPRSRNLEEVLKLLVGKIKESKQLLGKADSVPFGLRLVLAPGEQPPAASPTPKPTSSPASSPAASATASPAGSTAANPAVTPKEGGNPRAEKPRDGNQPPSATPQPTVSGTVKPGPTPLGTEIDDGE